MSVLLVIALLVSHSAVTASSIFLVAAESPAAKAYKLGDFEEVLRLLEQETSSKKEPSRELLRLACLSHLRLAHSEDAAALYMRLHPVGQADDTGLLREVALTTIMSRVRDPQEHVRIAAYTALAYLGGVDLLPVL